MNVFVVLIYVILSEFDTNWFRSRLLLVFWTPIGVMSVFYFSFFCTFATEITIYIIFLSMSFWM